MAWDSFLSDKYGPPVGVSRRQWNNIRTMIVLGTFSILVGIVILLFRFLVTQHAERLEETPLISLAEAAAHQGPPTGPVQVAGTLRTATPVTMPDSDEAVIGGRLRIVAKSLGSGQQEETVLLDWSAFAERAELHGGGSVLPVTVPPQNLPLQRDHRARAKIDREGSSARNSKPVRAHLGNLSYSLVELGYKSVSVKVERSTLPNDAPVVFLGHLSNEGLVTSPGDRQLTMFYGSPEEATSKAHFYGVMLIVLAIFAIIGGFALRAAGLAARRRVLRR
ncbi:hypothetical protein SCOR_15365 [Sulfidibacter corallicola]|uniref:Uncharacterized protein n=1 Tax=Sulfidibacter corallicola TaxID=2818388 RepID=A0A8A4TYI6_SULCO|nr:hypothetical protein [Sulfidibacter corallicola]QTD54154.1 hypothetical protein J3U87_17040 [Sulfidibacter corallicola]